MKATFVKNLEGWGGDARLFSVEPPAKWDGAQETNFLIVSGVDAFGEPETYIFPSDGSGVCLDLRELDGSFRGAIDHVRALENAGYELA